LLVQWGAAVRALSHDVRETSRRITVLATSLQPIVQRAERLSRPLQESEEDVRRIARGFHEISLNVAKVSDGVQRAVTWGTLLAPVVATAVEHLRARQAAEPGHDEAEQRARGREAANGRHPEDPS
jgi:methyl-accepting chemotaxis protein